MWTGENDKEAISVDAIFFLKRSRTVPFSFENGVVWIGSKSCAEFWILEFLWRQRQETVHCSESVWTYFKFKESQLFAATHALSKDEEIHLCSKLFV